MAADLGATLLEEPARLTELYRELGLTNTHPCHLDLQFHDGAWRRLSDHAAVADDSLPPPRDQHDRLAGSDQGCIAIPPTASAPTLLLRWPPPEAFARRREAFLENALIQTIEVDGRSLALCRIPLPGYELRKFLHFLGLRSPVLDSPEMLDRLLEQLPPQIPCALGPIAYYREWEQTDGTVLFELGDRLQPYSGNSPRDDACQLVLCAHHHAILPANRPAAVLVELP